MRATPPTGRGRSLGRLGMIVLVAVLGPQAASVGQGQAPGRVPMAPHTTGPMPAPAPMPGHPGVLLLVAPDPAILGRGLPFAPGPEQLRRFWVVRTHGSPQVMGSDPWPGSAVLHFDGRGRLVPADPNVLFAQAVGRPVLVVINGHLVAGDRAVNGGLWAQSLLGHHGALPPDALVVVFDWPSDRVHLDPIRDLDEKQRRGYVAGYHLARYLQAFPPGSRVCLLGHSEGGRVIASALHLLGGGGLDSQSHDPEVLLPGARPALHLRAVVLAGADDHDWLDPGERFEHALPTCEAFLNLYNRRDLVLLPYPLERRTGHRRALGRVGLLAGDIERLGPLAGRYAERDMRAMLGYRHTLVLALSHPQIARWIAPYTWATVPVPYLP